MQEFADTIIAELEKGVKPWVRPWDPDKCAGPNAPLNPVTQALYHGIIDATFCLSFLCN